MIRPKGLQPFSFEFSFLLTAYYSINKRTSDKQYVDCFELVINICPRISLVSLLSLKWFLRKLRVCLSVRFAKYIQKPPCTAFRHFIIV